MSTTKKTLEFTARFVDELTAKAMEMTARECELMANVAIRRQFEKDTDVRSIEKMEDIYWKVSVAKRAAEVAGVELQS
jgi:hypothetical protein